MVRFARDANPKPIPFPDELSATVAALQHALAYFNGHLACWREIKGGTIRDSRKAKAEKLFRAAARQWPSNGWRLRNEQRSDTSSGVEFDDQKKPAGRAGS